MLTRSLKPLLLTTSSLVVLGVGFVMIRSLDPAEGPEVSPNIFAEPTRQTVPELRRDASEGQIAEALTTAPRTRSAADPILTEQASVSPNAPAPSIATASLQDAPEAHRPPARNQHPQADPNPLKITAETPVSTFSIDTDTASYSWVRRMLTGGQLPDPDAVRVEEMVNYFTYDYPAPTDDQPFATHLSIRETPWNADTQLLHIGIQGEILPETRPPLNLVFLVDTSGSMRAPDKLPLLIQSFRLMLSELSPQDQIAIVTYAGTAGTVLEPTSAAETATITQALNQLQAGGSTAGQAGLSQAYALAEEMQQDGQISRVILATDGDFNIGMSEPEQMKRFISDKRDSGTYLSVLGFGRGNINDALMQTLAQNGNGQAAYIDTLAEARKVLVDQLTGALYPIASDVKIQIEFNPARIAEYRLIGYETRNLNRQDFNNDAVDAGDIGAGHQITAIYQITPNGSPAQLSDPLRYGSDSDATDSDELGYIRLRYKEPGAETSQLIETPITEQSNSQTESDFAAAIAGFGQLLRHNKHLGNWGYSDAIALAVNAKGPDIYGYRSEAITLMRLAETLAKSP